LLSHTRHKVLIDCLAAHAAPVAESEHFALYRRVGADGCAELAIVHRFAPEQVDNNVGYYVANELLPMLLAARGDDGRFAYSEQELFERSVGAIVRSIDANERRAWHRFYVNSLAALARAMREPAPAHDFVEPFGAIYARVAELLVGTTLLDAGTCFGFMPLLLAEQAPQLERIVGLDQNEALIGLASAYADYAGVERARFVRADLLAPEAARLGCYDSVAAIHLLEHLAPEQTWPAIANLWRLTRRRLIVAVPIEQTPDARFGHLQTFDPARLDELGRRLEIPYRSFEYHGGWLVVDRV